MELLKKDEIASNDGMHFILGQMTAYNEVRKFVKKLITANGWVYEKVCL